MDFYPAPTAAMPALPPVASGAPTLDTIHCTDALVLLKALPDASIDCVVTSPPYWNLRDYQVSGQIGLEPTPAEFIARLMQVFREVHRVLKPTGTCWINLGDSYANDTKWGGATGGKHVNGLHGQTGIGRGKTSTGLPPKSLMMIPARFAIAMQDNGWILRSEIVWHKPSAMPESAGDRPTRAHEMVYFFAKEPRYWYDAKAVSERTVYGRNHTGYLGGTDRLRTANIVSGGLVPSDKGTPRPIAETRNLRDVWTIVTEPFADSHFAVMPSRLVETCIKAGCPPGGVVLDMFMGSGTVAITARRLGRHYIGCDLNPEYVQMARNRLAQSDPYISTSLSNGLKQLSLFAGAQPIG